MYKSTATILYSTLLALKLHSCVHCNHLPRYVPRSELIPSNSRRIACRMRSYFHPSKSHLCRLMNSGFKT